MIRHRYIVYSALSSLIEEYLHLVEPLEWLPPSESNYSSEELLEQCNEQFLWVIEREDRIPKYVYKQALELFWKKLRKEYQSGECSYKSNMSEFFREAIKEVLENYLFWRVEE